MKPLQPAVLALICLNSFNISAGLITFNAPDNSRLGNLDYYKSHLWQINLAGHPRTSGEEITGITLWLDDICNRRVEPNIFRISMLDQQTPFTLRDLFVEAGNFHNNTDFFAVTRNTVTAPTGYTAAAPGGRWQDADGGATKNDLAFAVNVRKFNEYRTDNNRTSFGFDPDCHFFNSGVRLEIATRTQSVPEPKIWQLFALSLLWIPFNNWKKEKNPSNPQRYKEKEN